MVDGIQELVSALQTDVYDSNTTYNAEVSSIDNEGTVWVYLAGSNIETPTALSSAEVSVGDNVNVEWRNNKLYIAGNVSNPSAGTVRVRAVEHATEVAKQVAQSAVTDAGIARQAAEQATEYAEIANGAAEDAQESASVAQSSADTAITQLGIVENIVGVLEMIQEHGKYEETADTEAVVDKRYFERSGTSPNYQYTLVANPSGDPHQQGWYELTGIDEAIQNYVSSHLILTNEGLELKRDDTKYRMRLNGEAMDIIAPDGTVVGSHGATIVLGDKNEIHFEATSTRIKFSTPNEDLCWFGMNSDGIWEMHVETTFVEKQVRYGDYAFIKRANGNMSLKWLGA